MPTRWTAFGSVASIFLMETTQDNGGYEAPKVEALGTITDLTLANGPQVKLDQSFPAGTDRGDLTTS